MLIARDIAGALDPAAFAERCDVTPDAWQSDFLRSPSRRVLQLAGAQVGKTTVTGLKCLHVATYEPSALILVIAPAARQSAEFVRSVRLMHKALDDAVPLKAESVTKLEFENDARMLRCPVARMADDPRPGGAAPYRARRGRNIPRAHGCRAADDGHES